LAQIGVETCEAARFRPDQYALEGVAHSSDSCHESRSSPPVRPRVRNRGAAVKTTRPDSAGTREPSLNELRAAPTRYKDVNVAIAEGYIRDPANICDAAEMMGKPKELGVMGIHFFRPDLLGITAPPNPRVDGTGTHTDFNKPAILIYEPQSDETLQLVAVENLVFIKAWEAAGNKAPPTYQGKPFDKMVDDPNTAIDEAHNFALLRPPRVGASREPERRVRAVQP
jgi:hypothetical protein